MDDSTVQAILAFFTACLPFAVAGIIWLENKLSTVAKEKGISDKQGDLIFKGAEALFAVAKAKFGNDPAKKAMLETAEGILQNMKATWLDPDGTNDMLEMYLSQLEGALKSL